MECVIEINLFFFHFLVMEIFVTSCSKLKALDFSDVTLQIGTLKLIADNCVHLQTLSISRCSDVKAEQLL